MGKSEGLNERLLQSLVDEVVALSKEGGLREGCRPFGAVVACDGLVIGRGISSTRLLKDPTAHAEILAIRNAAQFRGLGNLAGCILISSSEPCAMCLAAAYNSNVDLVGFGCTTEQVSQLGYRDGEINSEISKIWSDRRMPYLRFDAANALKVLHEFPFKA